MAGPPAPACPLFLYWSPHRVPLRVPPGPASAKCCVFQSSLLGVAGAHPAGTVKTSRGFGPRGECPRGLPRVSWIKGCYCQGWDLHSGSQQDNTFRLFLLLKRKNPYFPIKHFIYCTLQANPHMSAYRDQAGNANEGRSRSTEW